MKIGITGSKDYKKYNKLETLLYHLKNLFREWNEDMQIITRGDNLGVDRYVKTICKHRLYIDYIEFPPSLIEYTPKHHIIRNAQFINFCDLVLVFTPKNIDDLTVRLINMLEKANKKYLATY